MGENMKLKNVIFIAIFSVLYFVMQMVIHAVFGMNPITFFFYYGIAAIPCGIIYMYVRAKAPCRWSVLLMGVTVATVAFLMGIVWPAALGMLVGGIFAEFISRAGNYTSNRLNIIGYMVFICCLMIGQTSYMIFGSETFMSGMLAGGAVQEYLDAMVSAAKGPLWFAALAVAALGSLAGGVLGNRMFRKHFANL